MVGRMLDANEKETRSFLSFLRADCNGQTIVQITDMLRKQGFLLATPGSKSKGFLEKGLPKFTLSTEPAIKERLRNEIFNPLAKISHHVCFIFHFSFVFGPGTDGNKCVRDVDFFTLVLFYSTTYRIIRMDTQCSVTAASNTHHRMFQQMFCQSRRCPVTGKSMLYSSRQNKPKRAYRFVFWRLGTAL